MTMQGRITSDLEDESLDETRTDENPSMDIAGDEPEPEPAPRGAQISEALKAERRKQKTILRARSAHLEAPALQSPRSIPNGTSGLQEASAKNSWEREIAPASAQMGNASAARKG